MKESIIEAKPSQRLDAIRRFFGCHAAALQGNIGHGFLPHVE
jgi:hypothetical protein